jgi:hypothetical protein
MVRLNTAGYGSNTHLYFHWQPYKRTFYKFYMPQGEKNVLPDQSSNQGPSDYRSATLTSELSGRFHIFSTSEQFWIYMQSQSPVGCQMPRVRNMCSLSETQTQDPRNTVPRLYWPSSPAVYTSSPLNSEQFWTVTNIYMYIHHQGFHNHKTSAMYVKKQEKKFRKKMHRHYDKLMQV